MHTQWLNHSICWLRSLQSLGMSYTVCLRSTIYIHLHCDRIDCRGRVNTLCLLSAWNHINSNKKLLGQGVRCLFDSEWKKKRTKTIHFYHLIIRLLVVALSTMNQRCWYKRGTVEQWNWAQFKYGMNDLQMLCFQFISHNLVKDESLWITICMKWQQPLPRTERAKKER